MALLQSLLLPPLLNAWLILIGGLAMDGACR